MLRLRFSDLPLQILSLVDILTCLQRSLHGEQHPMNAFKDETFSQTKKFFRPFPLLSPTMGIYANTLW